MDECVDKPAMSGEAMGMVANYFKLLAEPLRLHLLQALRRDERSVQELVDMLNCSQANVSKHLKLLHEGGLLDRRKDGLHVYYRVSDPLIDTICDLVCNRQQGLLAKRAAAFAPGAKA
jgi:DNA-binding transcriptional ArsR family regulator